METKTSREKYILEYLRENNIIIDVLSESSIMNLSVTESKYFLNSLVMFYERKFLGEDREETVKYISEKIVIGINKIDNIFFCRFFLKLNKLNPELLHWIGSKLLYIAIQRKLEDFLMREYWRISFVGNLKRSMHNTNICDGCGGRCSFDMNIHVSMLKCEQCGCLTLNPNYVPFFGCH